MENRLQMAILLLMSVQTERAYAKINLGLRIIRRRLDGYRDIETVFHRIALHDELTFEEADALSLVCSDPSLPTDETNLCMRAAAALRDRTGVTRGARRAVSGAEIELVQMLHGAIAEALTDDVEMLRALDELISSVF